MGTMSEAAAAAAALARREVCSGCGISGARAL